MATLLVIEDELTLAKNVARYFEKLNHKVAVAHDGPENQTPDRQADNGGRGSRAQPQVVDRLALIGHRLREAEGECLFVCLFGVATRGQQHRADRCQDEPGAASTGRRQGGGTQPLGPSC